VLDRFSGEIRCTRPSNSPTSWDLHMINTVYIVGSSLETVGGAGQILRGIRCTRPSNSPTRWDLHMINTVYVVCSSLEARCWTDSPGRSAAPGLQILPHAGTYRWINTVYVVGSRLEAVRGARQILRGDPLHQAFKFSHTLGPTHDQYRVYRRQQP
jgi:hypothetical protein